MYTQEYFDNIYLNQSRYYQQNMQVERFKNYISILAALFTIAAAIYLMTHKK
jgi:hypothetical protein